MDEHALEAQEKRLTSAAGGGRNEAGNDQEVASKLFENLSNGEND